jgi:hypothetical protein
VRRRSCDSGSMGGLSCNSAARAGFFPQSRAGLSRVGRVCGPRVHARAARIGPRLRVVGCSGFSFPFSRK